MSTETPTLLFLHIFKCGGTFLTGGIRYSFSEEEIQAHNLEEWHSSSYRNKSLERKEKIRLYHGHFSYGIHAQLKKPCIYITTVRDPVNQLLSIYYNLREEKCKYNPLYKIFHSFSFKECLSPDIYQSLSAEDSVILNHYFDNHQTRMLSGSKKLLGISEDLKDLTIDINDFTNAKKNLLSKFSFVEFCEETDSAWPVLNKKLGLEIPPVVWHSSNKYFSNKTERRPQKQDLPADIIKSIYKRNVYDYMLFELVKKNKEEINNNEIIIVNPKE